MTAITTLVPRAFTPKRGIKPITMTLTDAKVEYKTHHQKTLILAILRQTETKSMTLKDMIEKVESDDEMKAALNSKQSVFNCITYHMKDLGKLGVLKLVEATPAKVEAQMLEEPKQEEQQ